MPKKIDNSLSILVYIFDSLEVKKMTVLKIFIFGIIIENCEKKNTIGIYVPVVYFIITRPPNDILHLNFDENNHVSK